MGKKQPETEDSDRKAKDAYDEFEERVRRISIFILGAFKYIKKEWSDLGFNEKTGHVIALITLIALIIYTGYTVKIYKSSNRSADAAAKAADITAAQFELVERPQLSGDKMILVSPVVIDRNGMRLNFKVTFTNKGTTRAIKVFGAGEVFPLESNGPKPEESRDRMCKLAEERSGNSH